MSGLFMVLQTGYLFTEYQTVYTDCFKNETVAEYNKNVQQIKILLFPTFNESCQALSQPIQASLILKNATIPIIYTIDQQYNYENTTELLFQNIPDFVSESFMIVHIYTYSLITELNIYYFDEILSEIASCYTKISAMTVSSNSYTLTVDSTGLCRQQIETQKNSAGDITSQVIQGQLAVDGIYADIDFKQFVDSYTLIGQNFTYTGNSVFPGIREKAVVYGRMVLTVQQGAATITLTTFIDFVNIQGMGVKFYGDINVGVSLANTAFHVNVPNIPDYDKIRDAVNNIGFTYYIKRLTVSAGGGQIILEQSFTSTTYNEKQETTIYACDSGSLQSQQQCRTAFNAAIEEGGTFYFDTLFYQNDEFKNAEKTVIPIYSSCWTQAFIQQEYGQICLGLVRQKQVFGCIIPIKQTLDFNMLLRFQKNGQVMPQQINQQIQLNVNQSEYCYACIDKQLCADIIELLKDHTIMIEAKFTSVNSQQNLNLMIITQKQQYSDFLIVKAITVTIGCVYIITCLTFSIYGIIYILKIQKKMKQRSKK
ncbi:hypothetical protein SS50377_26403 [Spironucleus salmonicida]|uniref:Transmembrane protein n=1 Tax=Spironucleus salmonicida TaxID=348837 RepID=V6LVL2_9EUKA|nr:hypothetical protein SS50377_26403 [Spironucleus salmonicida]|eukprot:EST47731.1 Hypothetical protein SS50377_12128 [Spironucleus salmonicida]